LLILFERDRSDAAPGFHPVSSEVDTGSNEQVLSHRLCKIGR
jgi:hypothetical protein